jgi:hypothetical protein
LFLQLARNLGSVMLKCRQQDVAAELRGCHSGRHIGTACRGSHLMAWGAKM